MRTVSPATSASTVKPAVSVQRAIRIHAAALARMMRRSRTRHRLAAADDATLKDLGISRTQAYFEASQPFWR